MFHVNVLTLMTTRSQKSWSCGIGSKWAWPPPNPWPAPPSSSWLLNFGRDLCRTTFRDSTNTHARTRGEKEKARNAYETQVFLWVVHPPHRSFFFPMSIDLDLFPAKLTGNISVALYKLSRCLDISYGIHNHTESIMYVCFVEWFVTYGYAC